MGTQYLRSHAAGGLQWPATSYEDEVSLEPDKDDVGLLAVATMPSWVALNGEPPQCDTAW
jgi:hypothetical protein